MNWDMHCLMATDVHQIVIIRNDLRVVLHNKNFTGDYKQPHDKTVQNGYLHFN